MNNLQHTAVNLLFMKLFMAVCSRKLTAESRKQTFFFLHRSLAFWLAAPEAQPGYAVTVLGATQEAYAAGAAVFDGRPAPHGVRDLAFRLYYQTGTWEGLAVLLARQADGRPGVFGWPPLYLALLLAYVLGVAMLLGVVINRLRL